MKNIVPQDFAKYLSYSEVKKNRSKFAGHLLQKLSMGTSFSKVNELSNWFVILRVAVDQKRFCRWSEEICCVQEISLKFIEQIVTAAYLNMQLQEVYYRRRCS